MPNTTEIFDEIPETLNDSQLTEWHPRATSNASKTEGFFSEKYSKLGECKFTN